MNTYEYIMERKRMCDSFGTNVEKWSAEHPKKQKKTRQDVFLEKYPETRIGDNGCICLCPGDVFNVYRNAYGTCAKPNAFCPNCRCEFWGKEVDGE